MTVAQRSSAERMLADKGQTVTLTHSEPGVYDPSTGTTTPVETTQQASAVILPFSQGLRKMAGTEVLATDRWCILAGLTTAGAPLAAPVVNDTLTDVNSVVWAITEVSPLTPAGLDIIFELTLRGSGA